ncbi:MAG TPA: hypothetical protein VD927_00875 [Chryseosolibacter sp.]|nr:hypothetical protein [Chryseosolibacter sp.]
MKTNSNKQVAAFDQVLGHCNALGEKYNPSMESMNVAALNSLLSSAQSSVMAVDTAKVKLIQVINERQKAFAAIPGIATRILNMLIVSEASSELIADARRYRDKLRSPRRRKTVRPEASATTPHVDASRGPVSYMDFESRLSTFGTIIKLVESTPLYHPNETDFAIPGLKALLTSLYGVNKAVHDAHVAVRNARLAKRMALYGDRGLYGVSKKVKRYILFVFGATSQQYRMFSSITLKSR